MTTTADRPHARYEAADEGIARLVIDRPDKLGAYTPRMIRDLLDGIARYVADDSMRVLILTGTGRGFCTGGDVSPDAGFAPGLAAQVGRARDLREHAHAVVLALHRTDKPVVCAINGFALNGGLAFALCADLRIAARSARLGSTSSKVGLLADEGGAWLFPQVMGYERAYRMVVFSELYDAERARELGLVGEVVDDDALEARSLEVARQLRDAPPLVVRATKLMMRRAMESSIELSLGDAQQAVLWVGPSADAAEGKQAFLEKRAPIFRGE